MIAQPKDLFSLRKKVKFIVKQKYFSFVLALVCIVAAAVAVFGRAYAERIYPGIMVGSTRLGEMDFNESRRLLVNEISQLPTTFTLTYGDKKWQATLEQMGLRVNVDKTLTEAKLVGRRGDFLKKFMEITTSASRGLSVPLALEWDEIAFQQEVSVIAAEIEKLPENPGILIENGVLVINRGQDGKLLRRDLLKAVLENRLRTNSIDHEILLVAQSIKVELTVGEESQIRSRAEKLLGNTLTLDLPESLEENPVVLTDKVLVGFLSPEVGGKVEDSKVANYAATLAESVNRLPENAIFQFVAEQGRVAVFKPGKDGISLDIAKTTEKISQEVLAMTEGGEKIAVIQLPIVKTPPAVMTSSVNNLGIKELLGRGISYFSGSIQGRIHNIILGTSRLNGALVAPGEEFSFNKSLGDVSAETGYQQAYVIKGGRTVLGDGGGVCQISTTLFRAVLAAGLPVVERWAHAYRVHYYEEKTQVGLDATVYSPSVDFRFKNDTSTYILIQARVDEKTEQVSFELYGTSDGRQASISKTRTWDVTAPPPDLYQDDPTLSIGQTKQVDFSAWGAKTAFDWTVTREGEILQKKTFYSNYQPWRAIFLRGTKQI